MIPAKVINDIQAERTYQLTKGAVGKVPNLEGWSYDFDNKNTPSDWARFITAYLGKAVPTGSFEKENFRKNMLKVATLAIAAVEQCDRMAELPKTHWQ